ncbi:ChrR family anti-sigma-E factor [Oceanibaculum sp.]|uniref:ChrR family anti-sigma-E factor n=1 Tax=Oceanibaculum sp. TaxID=1903597 RepID=UPI0025827395|nr:ChrR family anti-sigma-E factor [Oceanibaculum sp.]MCH2395000.1 ChrR family anti-sigma-E factor [Oceanibaculum sp.]
MMFHVSEEHLMDYAAGTASEPVSLLVATHLALCPECRAKVADYERIGGAMLADSQPADLTDAALDAVLARLDEEPADLPAHKPAVRYDEQTRRVLPEPLRSYLGDNLGALPWRNVTRSLQEIELPIGDSGYRTRLLRIKAGQAMPEHTHGGSEMTLVLAGGFSDDTGHYGRGDVSIADDELVHTPVADAGEDCICLAVTDAPLKLTGPVGRIINLFMRY